MKDMTPLKWFALVALAVIVGLVASDYVITALATPETVETVTTTASLMF